MTSSIAPPPPVKDRMALDHNALSSLAATLDDVRSRIAEIAASGGEEDLVSELLEVERQLTMSSRRLDKAIRRMSNQ